MLFGSKADFAIECVHEPNHPNDRGWVFGRMRVWCRGVELGDFGEPDCMLNVTESHFLDTAARLGQLRDEAIDHLPDEAAFRLLDTAIYGDDDRTMAEVVEDAKRYRNFDLLTNAGESFDGTKAFVHDTGTGFRLLYHRRRPDPDVVGSGHVTREGFVAALRGFLDWMAAEKRQVPTAG